MSKNLIDPAEVQKVIDRHSWADENADCKSVLDDVLRDLRNLLCPEHMFGMRAKHPVYGDVLITVDEADEDGYVWFAFLKKGKRGQLTASCGIESLAFPEQHPEHLTSPEEYKKAPGGTIVADDNGLPIIRRATGLWKNTEGDSIEPSNLHYPRRVLRWGWGK